MPAEAPIDFSEGKAYRAALKSGVRAHVDRPLPFLILHRFARRGGESLALQVASTSPSYLLWPEAGDGEALALTEKIAGTLCETSERVLLVSLYDLPRDPSLDDKAPRLERFTCRLGASEDPAAWAAANLLERALGAIEVDLRTCTVERESQVRCEPGVEALTRRAPGLSHISLGLPQNYRIPGEDGIYPQLLHELSIGVFDALLQAFCAFIAETSARVPSSHRALGRSSFIAAARTVDRKLFKIATSFDFLLSVSPINNAAAYENFKASHFEQEPVFHYRPLTVDPERTKRDLYAIDLRRVEDPVLETLFSEKRRELDQQLTMLECRNTPDFRYASLMLYGPVEHSLLDSARDILAKVENGGGGSDTDMVDAPAVRDAALLLVGRYRAANPAFEAKISLRADIAAGMMVSGRELLIAADTRMRRRRLEALLQHEVSVHLLTCVNGAAQGLQIFETGLAGYEGVQEGLGVFAECAVGGLNAARLRLLAARVIIVDAMIEGADFMHCFRLLRDEHGFGARVAFNIVARVFRSGGLAKDAIYLRGFKEVLDHLAAGRDLAPFWFGKIAARHIKVVEELELRGLLRPPRSLPEFLASPEARARIAAMARLASLSQLIPQEI
ncbi:MAG TPA: flavohemoglobin expression-modulating QEGLA motif protein [Allosphingosinicella sp.]|nr:flavohemoglobin expression-modulating QEGLA motif protein [Allosphingosinicella sp.]